MKTFSIKSGYAYLLELNFRVTFSLDIPEIYL